MNKICIILRGTANSGKSTFAEFIKNIYNERKPETDAVICCADDYFTDKDGNYNWNPDGIGKAHQACKHKFTESLGEVELIIVANTNTTEREYGYYLEQAQNAGYIVFSLVVEKRHNNKNNHKVPADAIHRQAGNIFNSLKLE